MPERSHTAYDVARSAGVSQSAVSRAFRPGSSIAPKTLARVLAAAKELDYQPNAMAQSLITRRSNLVALIVSNLTNLHYPEVLAQLTQRLSDRGARALLFALKAESDIDGVLDQVWRYRVDGAIVAARLSDAQLRMFAARQTALVLYNRIGGEVPVASVACDFGAGETLLIDSMYSAGARKFAIIGGPPDSTVGEARVAGACDRLRKYGIDDVPIERGDFSYEGGYRATLRLFKREAVDAIIAANDVMGLGAMDAARFELGLTIPDQVAVVGFDGVAPAYWRSYNLTSMRQPVERMTEAAVAMLFERIEDPEVGAERRLFASDPVIGSSAPFKPGAGLLQ